MNSLSQIQKFLSYRRLAMVGVSHNPKDFSRGLFRELRLRGYDVAPVHLSEIEIDGVACVSQVQQIVPRVEAALVMTASAATAAIVRDCHAAGIHDVWLYRATGAGSVSTEALAFCQANGISVVAGECPFMFLPETGWIHRFHGACRKLTGSYPMTA